jgi:hypothetical protein
MPYDDPRPPDDPAAEIGWLADDHGTPAKWWPRYHRLVERVRAGAVPPDTLRGKLFLFASNAGVLKAAWDRLERRGGPAPGEDGIRYSDLTGPDRWAACRVLRDAVRDHAYAPGPERVVQVPKPGGKETRPIAVQSVVDRVVQRAVASVLHPLLDPDFDPRSFGFRPGVGGLPGRDRRHALAAAQQLAFDEGRFVWVLADLRDAFGSVPLGRLLDVVRKRVPDPELVGLTLTRTASGASAKRGLRQGSSLSPLLLNVYLDHALDRPWRQDHPDVPLLRYADDLLLLCRDRAEADECLAALRRRVRPAGFTLKDPGRAGYVRDLGAGRVADWLGFRVAKNRDRLSVRPARAAYSRLHTRLVQAHEAAVPSLAAAAAVRGWFDQMGPCHKGAHRLRAYEKAVAVAARAGFVEVPAEAEAMDLWAAAYARWRTLADRRMPTT